MRLVVGYGNPLCGDDGAGPYVVEKITEAAPPDVETRIFHQLPLEWVPDIHRFSMVMFVDAGVQVPDDVIQPVKEVDGECSVSMSHVLVPGLVMRLSGMLYGSTPPGFVCTILGDDFTLGAQMTEATRERADHAV